MKVSEVQDDIRKIETSIERMRSIEKELSSHKKLSGHNFKSKITDK